MRLILDADAIIKLNRAGILRVIVRAHVCFVTSAVYDEAVTAGKVHGYLDAMEIEDILGGKVQFLTADFEADAVNILGPGEQSILAILAEQAGATVVSDDQRFLSELRSMGVPSITPPGLVVLLSKDGAVTLDEALSTLDKMKPVINGGAYFFAMTEIGMLEERQDR